MNPNSDRSFGVVTWGVAWPLLVIAFCGFLSGRLAQAQEITVALHVTADNAARAVIEGTCKAQTKWSFLDSSGGMVSLGARIENFEVFGPVGEGISTVKLAPGQYSSAPATKFKYEVRLAAPVRASDAAKISWVSSGAGLLMLRDLLPVFEGSLSPTSLRVNLPSGWTAYGSGREIAGNTIAINDADNMVIPVGNRLRISERIVGGALTQHRGQNRLLSYQLR